MNYPEHSAGRYMTPEYVSLKPDMQRAESPGPRACDGKRQGNLERALRGRGRKADLEVRLGSLVMAEPEMMVRDIPDRPLVSVQATADREAMVELFEKYDRVALPVTDNQGNMLGIITADDVLDVAEMEATEDMQKMGGTRRRYLSVGFWHMVRERRLAGRAVLRRNAHRNRNGLFRRRN